MTFSIRNAAVEDLPAVAELFARSFDPGLHPYLTQAQHGAAEYMSLPIRNKHLHPGHDLLVAVHHNKIVGVADFRKPSMDAGFLSYLFVADEARGRGLATDLVQSFVTKSGVSKIGLDVFTSNDAANALYTKLGFSAGPKTTWVSRPLPERSTPESIEEFASQYATHKTFGFCTFVTDGLTFPPTKFGRIGNTVLKCFSPQTFSNDDALARVRASLPQCTEAFAMLSDTRTITVPHRVIESSERRIMLVGNNS